MAIYVMYRFREFGKEFFEESDGNRGCFLRALEKVINFMFMRETINLRNKRSIRWRDDREKVLIQSFKVTTDISKIMGDFITEFLVDLYFINKSPGITVLLMICSSKKSKF